MLAFLALSVNSLICQGVFADVFGGIRVVGIALLSDDRGIAGSVWLCWPKICVHCESWAKAEVMLQCGHSCPSLVTVRWPGTAGDRASPASWL